MRSGELGAWWTEELLVGSGAKLWAYNGDMEELYHFEKDPLELNNLAYNPEYLERKKKMHAKLIQQGFVGIGPDVQTTKF